MAIFATPDQAADHIDRSPLLAAMRELAGPPAQDEMEFITRQLMTILDEYYVHLPLKRSSMGIDPVRESLLLLDELPYIPTESEFHRRLFDIVKRLRDRHTAVRLPSPWREAVAYLPFALESYFDAAGRHVIVSKLMSDVGDARFEEGVEILHWNGVRIGRHVENLSWETEGANPFARVAIALRSLTARPLGYMAMPDEDWVSLSYRGLDGRIRSVVVPWRIYFPPPASATAGANSTASAGAALVAGLDRLTLLVNMAWYDLFQRRAVRPEPTVHVADVWRDTMQARIVRTRAGDRGYLRIFSFEVPDPGAFVDEVARVLSQVPRTGVIIDVRANPGGSIPAGEALMSLFTKDPIRPERTSFRNTAATRRLGRLDSFDRWRSSLDIQVGTGEVFSQGFPLTREIGPRPSVFEGPVVVIVDALCYSTTDFFAAGMQDTGLATVVGVDPVTGAGGANVWSHSVLSDLVAQVGGRDIAPLPRNFDIDVAIRRSTRVGPREGIPLEGLGVFAEHTYPLNRDDVLGDNGGLVEFASDVLAAMH